MNKLLSVLIATAFAFSLNAVAADAPKAAESKPATEAKPAEAAPAAPAKKARKHWCKATQQFQSTPCPKKPRKHWCKTTQQFQSEPCQKPGAAAPATPAAPAEKK